MNSSWILPTIAVASILSPVIVSISTNIFNERMAQAKMDYDFKKLTYQQESSLRQHRIELLGIFAGEVNKYLSEFNKDSLNTALETGPKLLIYFTPDIQNEILKLTELLMGFSNYSSEERSDKVKVAVHEMNTQLPGWLTYLEQLPIKSVPEPPRLRKASPIQGVRHN